MICFTCRLRFELPVRSGFLVNSWSTTTRRLSDMATDSVIISSSMNRVIRRTSVVCDELNEDKLQNLAKTVSTLPSGMVAPLRFGNPSKNLARAYRRWNPSLSRQAEGAASGFAARRTLCSSPSDARTSVPGHAERPAAAMSPARRRAKQRREKRRAAKAAMSPEEFAALEDARRKDLVFLRGNWSVNIPQDVTTLIIDGGNHPRERRRRSAITARITRVISACPALQRCELITFFERAPGKHGVAKGQRVIYAGDEKVADKIVEMVEAFGRERTEKTAVVTRARYLALRLMKLGAYVIRTNTFNALTPSAKAYSGSIGPHWVRTPRSEHKTLLKPSG